MEAGAGEAVRPPELEGPEPLATQHRLPHADARGDRLVGRAGRAVVDDHDTASGQGPGEGDPARESGQDRLAGRTGEVDAAMAPAEGSGGRLERPHHLRLRLQRPHPHGNRVHGSTERTGWSREGEHGDHQQDDDGARHSAVDPDRGGEWRSHAVTVPGSGAGRGEGAEGGGRGCRETRLWTVGGPSVRRRR